VSTTLLTEDQFRKLCDDLYRDRHQIYEFNPSAPRSEVLLWTLLGSLYSLLDLNEYEVSLANGTEHPAVAEADDAAPADSTARYVAAICRALDQHRLGQYDPLTILNGLIAKIELD
jgi:hypothetical protein